MPKDKKDENQSHIKCDAHKCIYNDNNKHCTAKQITIGNNFASTSDDTVCETFKQKSFH